MGLAEGHGAGGPAWDGEGALREDPLRIPEGLEGAVASTGQAEEGGERETEDAPGSGKGAWHRDLRDLKALREDEMRLARWVRIRLQGLTILPQEFEFHPEDNENSLKGF